MASAWAQKYLGAPAAGVPPSEEPEEPKVSGWAAKYLSAPTGADDQDFRSWYAGHAQRLGLDPNPDAPEHFYDYRAAYRAGTGPDETGHWPSQFKLEDHPRATLGILDTRTGEPVRPAWAAGAPTAAEAEEVMPGFLESYAEGNLGTVDRLGRAAQEGTANALAGLAGAAEAAIRMPASVIAQTTPEGPIHEGAEWLAEHQPAAAVAQRLREAAEQSAAQLRPEEPQGDIFTQLAGPRPVEAAVTEVVRNVPQLAASIAATAYGGPAAGLATSGALEGGGAYSRALQEGAEPEQAEWAALATAVMNAPLDYLPVGALFTRLKGASRYGIKQMLQAVGGQAALEGGTEAVQELNGQLAAVATYAGDQGVTFHDLKSAFSAENLREYGAAGVVGLLLGGVAGGVAGQVAPGEEAAPGPVPEAMPPATPEPAGIRQSVQLEPEVQEWIAGEETAEPVAPHEVQPEPAPEPAPLPPAEPPPLTDAEVRRARRKDLRIAGEIERRRVYGEPLEEAVPHQALEPAAPTEVPREPQQVAQPEALAEAELVPPPQSEGTPVVPESSEEVGPEPEVEVAPARRLTPAREPPAAPPVVESPGAVEETTEAQALHRLAASLRTRLDDPRPLAAPELFEAASREMGGSLAEGSFSAKDTYDALELAVNLRNAQDPEASAGPEADPETAARRLQRLEEQVSRLPTQTRRTGETESFQQFSTPPPYAYLVNWVAAVGPGDTVLEPSAGTGSLAAIARASGAQVYGNELAPRRAAMLRHPDLGLAAVFTEDAEQLNNVLPEEVRPTVVVMNPPFSQTAGRMGTKMVVTTGASHIEQALKRLADGGRLVAIVGGGRQGDEMGGMRTNAPAFRGWWGKIRKDYNVRANVGIAGKVYSKYGTAFNTRLLVIDKTGPTTAADSVLEADASSLDQALGLLEGVRDDRAGAVQRTAAEPRGEVPAPEGRRGPRPRLSVPAPTGEVGAGQRRAAPAAGEEAPRGPVGEPRPDVDVAGGGGLPAPPAVTGAERGTRERPGRRVAQPRPEAGGEPAASEPADEPRREAPSTPAVEEEGPRIAAVQDTTATEQVARGELTDSIYEPYEPQRLKVPGAKPHPGALVQSAAMSAVAPPKPTYTPAFSQAFVASGKLSLAQIEVPVYAGQAHSQLLPALKEGEPRSRRGFMVGDGTGVGKGREISAVLLDNWNQGRRKAVWVSEKWSLLEDAQRDWSDLGQPKETVFSLKKIKQDDAIRSPQGIAFTTYDTLRVGITQKAQQKAQEKSAATGREIPKTRVDQLAAWLGPDYDGVVVFDEAHNMANSTDSKGSRGVKTASGKALAGMELQRRLPNARVLYVSATAATEVDNLAYADRLGLWGPGTPFADRADFVDKIKAGGVAAMELVARDMKAMGAYVARSLAFSDGTDAGTVQYDRVEQVLSPEQREVYDVLADSWQLVLRNIGSALELVAKDSKGKVSGKAKAAALSAFWGAHQRFFSQIITSLQMPAVIGRMEADIADGRAVVAQLVNTLEANQTRQLAKLAEEEDLEDFDLTPRDQLMQFVEHSFPTAQLEEYEDDEGNVRMRPAMDSSGNPVRNREAVAMRDVLLDQLGSLRVPEGPLDMLLRHFGADQVAEVTGRTQRVIRDRSGKLVRERRGASVNTVETDAFNRGKKNILVFSSAGGTGRSYHASNTYKNKKRRAHYLLQPGWRADTAIQGLGRTHRTNQASAPIYRLASTDLAGHKRFVSSIARRLDQLGALTSGQRQTGGRGIFGEKDNLESPQAQEALHLLFRDLVGGRVPEFSVDQFEFQTGLRLVDPQTGGLVQQPPPITQFLNRLLSLRTDAQRLVFSAFEARLDAVVEAAIARGDLDVGTETIRAARVEKAEERTVYSDPETGAATQYVRLRLGRKTTPLPFASVKVGQRMGGRPPQGFALSHKSGKIFAYVESSPRTDAKSGQVMRTYRLTDVSGDSRFIEADKVRGENWETVAEEKAQALWGAQVAALPELRWRDMHLLTGVLLPVWDRVQGLPRVYRVQTDAGERLLGRSLEGADVEATLRALGASARSAEITPAEAVSNVLEGKVEIVLANGWRIKRRRVAGEYRIELAGDDLGRFSDQLQRIGLFVERHEYRTRHYIPTGEKGVEVYTALTSSRPVSEVVEMYGRGEEERQGVHGQEEVHGVRGRPRRGAEEPRAPRQAAWLSTPSDSPKGRDLLQRFAADPDGRLVGVRTINEFLADATQAELRVGKLQTTARRPAQFERLPHLIRARTPNSLVQIPHEAGHALSAILRERDPKLMAGLKSDLVKLTKRSGSRASKTTSEEGFAEWVRLYVTDPGALPAELVTKVEAAIAREAPAFLGVLRDAARMVSAHDARSVEAQFRSQSRARGLAARERAGDVVDRVLFNVVSRRRGLHRLENQVWAAFRDYSASTKAGVEAARAFWGKVRDTPADVERAYQSTLHILPEVTRALEGTGKGASGIRIHLDDGSWRHLTQHSMADIVAEVGPDRWEAFETYGQMRASLPRIGKGQAYVGATAGIAPSDLRRRVTELEAAYPAWPAAFKRVEEYFGGLLEAAVVGGLKTREEADRMKAAYGDYWPLLRQVDGDEVFGAGPSREADPGFRRAFGSEAPLLPILEAARQRTTSVLRAYYWNRALLAPVRLAETLAKDTTQPIMVRAVTARIATRLDPSLEARKKLATVAPSEAAKMIADYLNMQALSDVRGAQVELDEVREMSPDDFQAETGVEKRGQDDISIWWRPGDLFRAQTPKETAADVVVAREDGERVFIQIHDPVLFDLFTKARQPSQFMDFFGKLFGPMTAPWKRLITQSAAFVLGNVPRDATTAVFLGEQGGEGLIPGFYAVNGLIGRLTGKEAAAASEGELLSRTLDQVTRPVHQGRVERFKQIAKEGIVLDGWRDMGALDKMLAFPGQAVTAVVKPIELALWATGQRWLAETSEAMTREGAYLAVKKAGASDERAQVAFDLVTGNFGEVPGNADIATFYKIAGFLNPTVQITYEQARKLAHPDPAVRHAAYLRVGWVGLLSAVGWAINQLLTPDDKLEELKERTDIDRLSYMPIGGWLRIPFDYGLLGAVQSYVWNSLDARIGEAPPIARRVMARKLIGRTFDLPGHPMSFMQPQLKAFVEAEANYKFYFGEEIERDWMKYQPVEDRAFAFTPQAYRWLARHTGIGPLKIQHMISAGLTYHADETLRAIERVRQGRPLALPDMPFIGRRFLRMPEGWSSRSVQAIEEADEKYAQLRRQLELLDESGGASTDQLEALEGRVDQLEALHEAMVDLRALHKDAKDARKAGNWKEARELEREMTRLAAGELAAAGPPPR